MSVSGKLVIGDNVTIGDFVQIEAHSKIGKNVLIASRVFRSDTNHGDYSGINQTDIYEAPNPRKLSCKEVHVGDNVWIGENVCILPGVSIGEGSIIGSNAVVTKSFPEGVILGGVPAKCLKNIIK